VNRRIIEDWSHAACHLLEKQVSRRRKECAVHAEDIADTIEGPYLDPLIVRQHLRDIRDTSQRIKPGWWLHTMTQDGFDAIAVGVDLIGVDTVPGWGRESVGLRLVLKRDDPVWLKHCYILDWYIDKRRNSRDIATWQAVDDGLLSSRQALEQQRRRIRYLEELQVNDKVDNLLGDLPRKRIANRNIPPMRIQWRLLSGKEAEIPAKTCLMFGWISANLRLFEPMFDLYIRQAKKLPPAHVTNVVKEEYETLFLLLHHHDPKTNFTKKEVFGDPRVTETIRRRLGLGSSGPQ
jgi:hypothetical protein